MEAADDGGQNGDAQGRGMSPDTHKTKLQLPMSCDPPGLGNPAKQLVWIVSIHGARQTVYPSQLDAY